MTSDPSERVILLTATTEPSSSERELKREREQQRLRENIADIEKWLLWGGLAFVWMFALAMLGIMAWMWSVKKSGGGDSESSV